MLKRNVAGYVPPAGAENSLTDGPDVDVVNPAENNAQFTHRTDVGALGASRDSGFESSTDSRYTASDSVVGSSASDLSGKVAQANRSVAACPAISSAIRFCRKTSELYSRSLRKLAI